MSRPAPTAWFPVFRVAFFGLLAWDQACWALATDAYGVGGFNVPHLDALSGVAPSAGAMAAVRAACSACSAWVALGLGPARLRTVAAWALALLFTGGVLVSRLDSLQHHYLIAIVLLLVAPVVGRGGGGIAATRRALQLTLAVVYAWTVVAKLDPAWLDGRLPAAFLGGAVADGVGWLAGALGVPTSAAWSALAWAVVAVEVTLAALLALDRGRAVVFALGAGFHLAMLVAGLWIGLFPWYMVVLLTCAAPDTWLARAARLLPAPVRGNRRQAGRLSRFPNAAIGSARRKIGAQGG